MEFNTNGRRYLMSYELLKVRNAREGSTNLDLANVVDLNDVNKIFNTEPPRQ